MPAATAEASTPCSACGWTCEQQRRCSYASSLQLFYGAHDRGVWSIGSDIILKEKPESSNKNEASSISHVTETTTIPVPNIIREWVDTNNRHFVLMDRVKGHTLESIWPDLRPGERVKIARQTAAYINQLRSDQSSRIEGIDDEPVYSGWLFLQGNELAHGPFDCDEAFWAQLAESLEELPEKAKAALRARMPSCKPYTFTHGDLAGCNIMIDDQKNVVGILDWETAGYFPVWWEFAAAGIGLGSEDAEWKEMLREHLQPFPDGRQFWREFYWLTKYPNLDEDGQRVLEDLLAA